jgi:3-hydroxyisobutyrate dehydrogenase-like beta-hydroxyacid dehydrogenase
MEIGFVGLGSMGGPMSRRLVEAGHQLTVFDTRKEAMEPLIKLGAEAARSPADVADRVETVLTSLPSLDIGMKVVSGDDGLIRGNRFARRAENRRDSKTTQHRTDRQPGERRRCRRREGHPRGHGVGAARRDRARSPGA